MISDDFLRILRCPLSQQPLKLAETRLISCVNGAIAAGRAVNRSGETVRKPLDAGLVNEAGTVLYAIYDDIPCLLVDEAIDLGPFQSSCSNAACQGETTR